MERTVLYMYRKIPPPPVVEGGKISADGIWGEEKKGEGKRKRKKGKERERKETKRKWEVAAPG